MTATIAKTEPTAVVKGDTAKWTKALVDYLPADGWDLAYAFVLEGSTTNQKTLACTDNGDGTHLATLSAAASALFSVGTYAWQASVSNGTERYTVAMGRLEIKPDFATLITGYDARTHVKKVLDAIEAVLENRASEEQNYVMVGQTQITNIPHAELLALRSKYRAEYRNEQAAARLASGMASGNRVLVRF
jgi:hypothetical protein